ncbi:Cell wall acid trehalase [Lachnellula subtilissima]|uniref:Cell wall acid trehalase n=1 Tax=Lachnellula subtilissima TaxID=602034 RepID=A0A8H8RIU2_9HELO|nr:Cell wall acid trehalase [Lachnellula subtilissima]
MSEQVIDDQNDNGGYPPAFPFLTGHRGNAMIVPLGYLGLKMYEANLTIRPALPAPLEHLSIPDFYFNGNCIRAQMNGTHTTLTRLSPVNVSGVFDLYPNASMPFILQARNTASNTIHSTHYQFYMNETVVVPNEIYWQSLSTPGNILQCRPAYSLTNNSQYGGSIGTRWLPPSPEAAMQAVDTTASAGTLVQEFRFDWGARIPIRARVALTNMTLDEVLGLQKLDGVHGTVVDIPAHALVPNAWEDEVLVRPYVGNTTVHVLPEPLPAGKFVILEVQGCQGALELTCGDGKGASLVDFTLIAVDP